MNLITYKPSDEPTDEPTDELASIDDWAEPAPTATVANVLAHGLRWRHRKSDPWKHPGALIGYVSRGISPDTIVLATKPEEHE